MMRALVVDDSPSWRLRLETYLARAGCRVDSAGSLAEANRLLVETPNYDIAFFDARLREGDRSDWSGLEALLYCLGPRVGNPGSGLKRGVVLLEPTQKSHHNLKRLPPQQGVLVKGEFDLRDVVDHLWARPSHSVAASRKPQLLLAEPSQPWRRRVAETIRNLGMRVVESTDYLEYSGLLNRPETRPDGVILSLRLDFLGDCREMIAKLQENNIPILLLHDGTLPAASLFQGIRSLVRENLQLLENELRETPGMWLHEVVRLTTDPIRPRDRSNDDLSVQLPAEHPCLDFRGEPIPQKAYFFGHSYSSEELSGVAQALLREEGSVYRGFQRINTDYMAHTERLFCRVIHLVFHTDFSVFYLSPTPSANVFFEIGLALGFGRRVDLLKHASAALPRLLEALPTQADQPRTPGWIYLEEGLLSSASRTSRSRTDGRGAVISSSGIGGKDVLRQITTAMKGRGEAVRTFETDFAMNAGSASDQDRLEHALERLKGVAAAIAEARYCIFKVDRDPDMDTSLMLGIAVGLGRDPLIVGRRRDLPADLRGFPNVCELTEDFDNLSTDLEPRLNELERPRAP